MQVTAHNLNREKIGDELTRGSIGLRQHMKKTGIMKDGEKKGPASVVLAGRKTK